MDYLSMLFAVVTWGALLYWLSQAVRVLTTKVELFENHSHKLLWFLVVVFVPIVGAVWFAIWQHQNMVRHEQEAADKTIRSLADAEQASKDR